MDQLLLLRDYVITMQRQIQSKNRQIKTLTQINQNLRKQNQSLSLKQTYVLNSTVCNECFKTKSQLSELQLLCNSLQIKYDNLQKQKSSSLTNSIRVLSSSCSQCSRLRRQLEQLNIKYINLEKYQTNYVTSTKIYSSANCLDCSKYKNQLSNKETTITRLNSQINAKNTRILNLQTQIQTLTRNSLNSRNYSPNSSRNNDLQRISYLNGQVQQYIALLNSLRSQIKVLNQQNQRYAQRIRQLQARPKQVQYIEKQLSPQIKQSMKALKKQIGELSNDNIILRRQNSQLKRQIMNLPKSSNTIFVQTQPYELPIRYNDSIYEERSSRHYRKSPFSKNKQLLVSNSARLSYSQKLKYQDLQRKIDLLQMQNEHLKGGIYTHI